MAVLNNQWAILLKDEFEKDYYVQLRKFLKDEYGSRQIYPDMYDIYNALHYTDYPDVKAVILGQDPYHGPGQAHGLSFSVKPGVPPPPSLINIYKELQSDLGCRIPDNGHLKKWTDQGVLLLNTALTVRARAAGSHRDKGWESFTDAVINKLNDRKAPVVFILWGRNAQSKIPLISGRHHLIIKSSHPSPYSADYGFFGSRPFSRTNAFLEDNGMTPIDWQIEDIGSGVKTKSH